MISTLCCQIGVFAQPALNLSLALNYLDQAAEAVTPCGDILAHYRAESVKSLHAENKLDMRMCAHVMQMESQALCREEFSTGHDMATWDSVLSSNTNFDAISNTSNLNKCNLNKRLFVTKICY